MYAKRYILSFKITSKKPWYANNQTINYSTKPLHLTKKMRYAWGTRNQCKIWQGDKFYAHYYNTVQTDLGRLLILPHFSIQNLRGPLLPLKAANPSYGMLEVPVTNWTTKHHLSIICSFKIHSIIFYTKFNYRYF